MGSLERRIVLDSQDAPDVSVVIQAAEVARAGGVLVLPTDSVYGICCAATPGNPAHRRIFQIKHRDPAQTLPWFIADAEELERYADAPAPWVMRLADSFWPGAVTLVVRASAEVPPEYALTPSGGGSATIALRVPGSEFVRAVVRAAGTPLAQTSANTHGNPSAISGADVEAAVAAAADLLVDAGPAPVGVASSIVDCTGAEPCLLREGAVTAAEVLLAASRV